MNRILKIYFFIFISAYNIGPVKAQKAETDITTFNSLTISNSVLKRIKAKTKTSYEPMVFYYWVESFIDTTSYGHVDSFSSGMVFRNIEEDKAKAIFKEFKTELNAKGNYMFLTHLSFDETGGQKLYYDLAIIQAENQFEAVKKMGTQALNYDIKNEAILEKLKLWDQAFGLNIIIVEDDAIEAEIITLPEDLIGFCEDIYAFCPDTVDQGYGTIEDMMNEIKDSKILQLWWD